MNPFRKIKDVWLAWKSRPQDDVVDDAAPDDTSNDAPPARVNLSRSMNVSHGLHMKVVDGKVVYRRKSRYVGDRW